MASREHVNESFVLQHFYKIYNSIAVFLKVYVALFRSLYLYSNPNCVKHYKSVPFVPLTLAYSLSLVKLYVK